MGRTWSCHYLGTKSSLAASYYFSPLSVNNLGVVNNAHVYNDGCISEHLHTHIYHKVVDMKGMNNVASLIVKML